MSWRGGLLALALALVVAWVLRPEAAAAHATLVRAEPGENAFLRVSPREIALAFSEPIDARGSKIRLLDSSGRVVVESGEVLQVNGLRARLDLPNLAPGIYNVSWQNLSSVDGHTLRGLYPFTVLEADGSVPADRNTVEGIGSATGAAAPSGNYVGVRWLAYLGLLLAAGPALVLLLGVEGAAARRSLMVAAFAGVVLVGLSTALGLLLIRDAAPLRSLSELLSSTTPGQYWRIRAGAVVVMLVALIATREWYRPALVAVLAGAAAFLWGFSATSHAAANDGSNWGTIADFLHGLAAIAWIGGVIGVVLTARAAGRSQPYRRLMRRFATVASLSVFVLLSTGLLNLLGQFNSVDGLWDTRYGLTLLAKLSLAAPLAALAVYNARAGRGGLENLAAGEPRRFRMTAGAEVVAGLLVFAATAALTQTTSARSIVDLPTAKPHDETQQVAGLEARFQVEPNKTGLNAFEVGLAAGGRAVEAERVRLTFRYQEDQSVGPSTLVLSSLGPGSFGAAGPYLPLEGKWRVEVEVRRAGAEDATFFFDVRPAGTPVTRVSRGSPWDNPAAAISWNEYGGLVALLIGLGLALFRGGLPERPRLLGTGAAAMTFVAFGMGGLLLFAVHRDVPTGSVKANPIFPDENSIRRGREIYQGNCVSCHGRTGVPPQGLDLNPYPLDLTIHVPQHPDGLIFQYISEGFPGTAMRAWGEGENRLSDEDIWHTVNYLRTLQPTDR